MVSVVSSVIAPQDTTTTIEFTNVNGGAGDLLLVVPTRQVTSGETSVANSVVYGAQSLTELINFNPYEATSAGAAAAWFLLAPSGTEAVTVTTGTIAHKTAAVYVLSGVNQSDPFGTPATHYEANSVTSRQHSVSSVAGGLVIDALSLISQRASSLDPSEAGQNDPLVQDASGSGNSMATSHKSGAASVTMGWTWSGGTSRSGYLLIPVNPAGAAGPRFPRRRRMLQMMGGGV